jgi:hypothetical protein
MFIYLIIFKILSVMSLFKDKTDQGVFVKISKGQISYTSTEDDPKATRVTYLDDDKVEQVTYKVYVQAIEGNIISAEYRKTKFGNILEISIENKGEIALLQLKTDHGITNEMVNLLTNVDVSKPIEISAWLWRNRTYVGIKQEGVKIASRYTKASGDGPQPIETKDEMGDKKYDWMPVRKFYYEYMTEVFIPKLEALKQGATSYEEMQEENAQKAQAAAAELPSPDDVPEAPKSTIVDDMDDDLPF